MTSSDESQDRELLERYGRASRAEPLAPSAAVRAAILAEAKRVAASLSVPAVPIEPERRRTRWKMTAWGTAAAALLAAVIIAPRLYHQAPAPGVPVPSPQAESMAPRLVNDAPTLAAPAAAPPPVLVPEQNRRYTAGSESMLRGRNASTPPLTAAAAAGDLVKSRELLDQGAAIDDRDASGRTPLMLAIGQNQIEAVRLLLDRGADPNVADNHGLTPLQLAQQSKFDDIAALLIKAGAH